MPHVKIVYSEKVDKGLDALLAPDGAYPVPRKLRGGHGTHMGYDRGGLFMWGSSVEGVAFTGVMHMGTGAMYIRPLVPDRVGNVAYNGESGLRMMGQGEVLQPLKHNAAADLLKGTFWEGLPSRSGHSQLGQSAAWDAILNRLGKGSSLKERCQGFGSDELFSYEDRYLGFSVTKRAGTAESPHELALRSGTFNKKFTKVKFPRDVVNQGGGITIPEDWAAVVKGGLEKHLT